MNALKFAKLGKIGATSVVAGPLGILASVAASIIIDAAAKKIEEKISSKKNGGLRNGAR